MAKKKEMPGAEGAESLAAGMVLASEAKKEADEALAFVKEHVTIKTPADVLAATKMAADIKERRAEIAGTWDSMLEPLKKAIDEVKESMAKMDSFFGPPVAAMDEAERTIKDRLVAYKNAAERVSSALLAQAGAAARAGDMAKATKLQAEAAAAEVPKVAGLSMPTTWDGRVTDPRLIPPEYTVPDVKTLKAKTKAMKCDPGIPGWEAFPVTNAAITVDRVER